MSKYFRVIRYFYRICRKCLSKVFVFQGFFYEKLIKGEVDKYYRKNDEWKNSEFLLIPIFINLHWSWLVVINPSRIVDSLSLAEMLPEERSHTTMVFFDSLKGYHDPEVIFLQFIDFIASRIDENFKVSNESKRHFINNHTIIQEG